jgi:anhydro-N-acetylmuramic acid kinase
MKNQGSYKVIGLMSGTSLDGLDIAYCTFRREKNGWSYAIKQSETISYSRAWISKLSTAHTLSGEQLMELDSAYGQLLGTVAENFMRQNKLRPDFISSHGHTIFHQPHKGFTYQLGNGQAIYATTWLPVVCDFRTLDVLRGGQGAPLVPAGDKFLFSDYDVCLNLGGIANISMDVKKARIAFDVCFTNMGLNYLAAKAGKKYDKDGAMANRGETDKKFEQSLDKVYRKLRLKRPSLGREIFEKEIRPLLDNEKIPLNNRLRTFTYVAAREIVGAILQYKKNPKVLCTGGGAFNAVLIAEMLDLIGDNGSLVIPEPEIVKFKEALVFAFLGVLRVCDEINCLKSVTGAKADSSSGVLVGF